jgi:hypothetical protein
MDFQTHTPTGVRTIRITIPREPFGVLMSGGLDSSVMMCLILQTYLLEGSTVPFCAINVRRGFGTEVFFARMIDRISSLFQRQIDTISLPLPPGTADKDCLTVPAIPFLDNSPYKSVFSADTSNPEGVRVDQAPERTPVEKQFSFKRWHLPFLHCDKSHVVQLMYNLGLTFIETESHTCFASQDLRCGNCFQCQERAWAYKTLDLTDNGIY